MDAPRLGGHGAVIPETAGGCFMLCVVMAHETPHTAPSTSDAPPFPHHLAVAPTTLEGAERLNADPPATRPQWQPEEGDFS